MIDFAGRAYPFVGFGDDPNTSIKFMMVRHPQAPFHAWEGGDAEITTFRPHKSNDLVEQYGGRHPWVLTVRLWLEDADAVQSLLGVVGSRATLRMAAHLTVGPAGTVEVRTGRTYLALTDTTLVSVQNVQVGRGRQPEVTATFRRAYGEGSYYGFAVYSEEGS